MECEVAVQHECGCCAGIVGLSASVALRDLGIDVICFEQVSPMSERSAGRSRIFRLTHTSVELVKFAQRARVIFDHWAEAVGKPLVDSSECVITVPDLPVWVSAMRDADAHFSLVDSEFEELRLPSRALPAELLVDHSGGVVDVEAVVRFLVGMTRTVLKAGTVYSCAVCFSVA